MKILVTGASGFIGRALVRELARRHEVVALARGRPELGVPVVRGTFSNTRICWGWTSTASMAPYTSGR